MIPRIFVQVIRWWWRLVFLAGTGMAADRPEPPRVENLTATSATIRWFTDVPTGTRVHYGREPNRLTQSVEGGVATFHEAEIRGLQPGTAYFFAVGTARKVLATGQFTTSSSAAASSSPASSSPIATARGFLQRLLGDEAEKPAATTAPASPSVAPPSRVTWGNPASLQDHYDRHGADFRAKSPEDYAAQAWRLRERIRTGALRVKIDTDGVTRVYDPATGAFAAYNRDGTTKTYFKPGSPDYFDRQPGQLMRTISP